MSKDDVKFGEICKMKYADQAIVRARAIMAPPLCRKES